MIFMQRWRRRCATALLCRPSSTSNQKWVDKVVRTEGELLIEDDLPLGGQPQAPALPMVCQGCLAALYRDAVKLDYPAALVVDWKAGKSANVDPIQLTLTSLMMFLQFPKLLCVRSDFRLAAGRPSDHPGALPQRGEPINGR